MSKVTCNGKYPFVHIPAEMFLEKLPKFLEMGVSPEIGVHVYNMELLGESGFDAIAEKLHEHRISCTVHGPFRDLIPGARDTKIRLATLERFKEALHLTRNFPKKQIVFHHGYWDFMHEEVFDYWFENSLKTWEELLTTAVAENFSIALENVSEKGPEILCKLMEKLSGSMFGVCFDPGHRNILSDVPAAEWLEALKPYLIEIHIHDNNGDKDLHMGIGEGNIDFESIFSWLSKNDMSPVCALEIRNSKEAVMSINKFRAFAKRFPNLEKAGERNGR